MVLVQVPFHKNLSSDGRSAFVHFGVLRIDLEDASAAPIIRAAPPAMGAERDAVAAVDVVVRYEQLAVFDDVWRVDARGPHLALAGGQPDLPSPSASLILAFFT